MNYERARWGLLGLLVGDALGVPYEFTRPEAIPPFEHIEYEPPKGFPRAHRVPPGTWSDDGSQALCVLEAIFQHKRTPSMSFSECVAEKLLLWKTEGYMAVEGLVFDIGNTTLRALQRYAGGHPATESGMVGDIYKTNGSLMRALPIAFMQDVDDREAIKLAMQQSVVTHQESEPLICCAQYVLWARNIAKGIDQPWEAAFDTLRTHLPSGVTTAFLVLIERWSKPPKGSGFVVDSLYSAKYAVDTGTDYESTVKIAIRLGDDTDTTAAIAGGIAGLKYQHIPKRWLDDLRGQMTLEGVLRDLERYCGRG